MNENQKFKQEHSRKDRERKTLFRSFKGESRSAPSLLFHATSSWDALLQFSECPEYMCSPSIYNLVAKPLMVQF